MFLDLSSSDKILLTLNANNNQITYPQQSILVDMSKENISRLVALSTPPPCHFCGGFLTRHEIMCTCACGAGCGWEGPQQLCDTIKVWGDPTLSSLVARLLYRLALVSVSCLLGLLHLARRWDATLPINQVQPTCRNLATVSQTRPPAGYYYPFHYHPRIITPLIIGQLFNKSSRAFHAAGLGGLSLCWVARSLCVVTRGGREIQHNNNNSNNKNTTSSL